MSKTYGALTAPISVTVPMTPPYATLSPAALPVDLGGPVANAKKMSMNVLRTSTRVAIIPPVIIPLVHIPAFVTLAMK